LLRSSSGSGGAIGAVTSVLVLIAGILIVLGRQDKQYAAAVKIARMCGRFL
jgi:hypothetical protein